MLTFLFLSMPLCKVGYIRHNDFLVKFGENLRKIRIEKGLSQDDIAFSSELSTNQIGRIERGQLNAGLSTLYEISLTLNIDIKELFDFER